MKNFAAIIILLFSTCSHVENKTALNLKQKPNIIFIYLDDLGYGDVSAYGATELETPNMDFLANNGRKFVPMDMQLQPRAHQADMRLLTGQYPWRNRNAKILPGTAPLSH